MKSGPPKFSFSIICQFCCPSVIHLSSPPVKIVIYHKNLSNSPHKFKFWQRKLINFYSNSFLCQSLFLFDLFFRFASVYPTSCLYRWSYLFAPNHSLCHRAPVSIHSGMKSGWWRKMKKVKKVWRSKQCCCLCHTSEASGLIFTFCSFSYFISGFNQAEQQEIASL